MKTISKLDKVMFVFGFLLVISIFTLAFVLSQENGKCAINPCVYAEDKNMTCYNVLFNNHNLLLENETNHLNTTFTNNN